MSDITTNSSFPESEENNIPQTSSPVEPQTIHKTSYRPVESAKKAVCSNWKTTAIGLILSCTGFIAFSPQTFGGEDALLVQLSRYITSGGLAVLGISSKDFNVSGGDKEE